MPDQGREDVMSAKRVYIAVEGRDPVDHGKYHLMQDDFLQEDQV
jgi:hypothetical protein